MAPEQRSFEELAAAGWREADLAWEEEAEKALMHLADGNLGASRAGFAACVRLTHAEFDGTDPRLGASLANHAAALVSGGEAGLSGRTLADARRVWENCDAWVARMTAPRVARSSMFHLRMEQRHRATYEARWRVKWAELVGEARQQVTGGAELELVQPEEAAARLSRWQREKPAMLNDTRKLMAATLLLACAPRA